MLNIKHRQSMSALIIFESAALFSKIVSGVHFWERERRSHQRSQKVVAIILRSRKYFTLILRSRKMFKTVLIWAVSKNQRQLKACYENKNRICFQS